MNNRRRMKLKTLKGPKFSDKDVWQIGFVLARHIKAGLVRFRYSERMGYPGDLESDEEWNNILDQMIWSFNEIENDYYSSPHSIAFSKWFNSLDKEKRFEAIIKDSEFEYTDELKEQEKEYHKKVDNGLYLFAKYISNLWD